MGWIYLAKNENMPALVKIGFTERTPKERLSELSSSTGVPGKFVPVGSWQVEQPDHAEKILFSELRKYRVDGEFFRLDVTQAKSLIDFLFINNKELNTLAEANNQKLRLSAEKEQAIRSTEIYQKKVEEKAIDDWNSNRYKIITQCTIESAKLFSKQELIKQFKIDEKKRKRQERLDLVGGATIFATGGMAIPFMMLMGGKQKVEPKTIFDELYQDFRLRFSKARVEFFRAHGVDVPEKTDKFEKLTHYCKATIEQFLT